LRQRLELFLQVCNAVDFAHKNLIIHRDIKPGNILIDGNGKAKLTDFGIAKLLDDQEDSEQTKVQARVMTKEYASPEQQNGDFITTTSDVYQLGVLLYELIARKKHKTQIRCTLIAQLLLQVLRVKSAIKKAFSTIAALVRIHLIGHLDVFWMINSRRSYQKTKTRNKSPCIPTEMF